MNSASMRRMAILVELMSILIFLMPQRLHGQDKSFQVMETTIADIQNAYKAKKLTARQLVQIYLDRIDAYDKKGPAINAVININPKALKDADLLDAAFAKSGLTGLLHGIP